MNRRLNTSSDLSRSVEIERKKESNLDKNNLTQYHYARKQSETSNSFDHQVYFDNTIVINTTQGSNSSLLAK